MTIPVWAFVLLVCFAGVGVFVSAVFLLSFLIR